MATPVASYRNPQPAQPQVDPGLLLKLSDDLAQLVAEGLIVPYRDEHNVTRYRPAELGKEA